MCDRMIKKISPELMNYIKNSNSKIRADKSIIGGIMSEDPKDWADMGIFTLDDLKKYDLQMYIWDRFRDVNGYRPRHLNFKRMNLSELEKMANSLKNEKTLAQKEEEWENQHKHLLNPEEYMKGIL
jgi:hypothetical protein